MSAAACGRCRRRCRGRRPRHGCPGPRPGCRRGGPGGTSQGPGPGCCRPSGRARRRRPRRLGGQGEGERGREGERERGREGGVRRGGVEVTEEAAGASERGSRLSPGGRRGAAGWGALPLPPIALSLSLWPWASTPPPTPTPSRVPKPASRARTRTEKERRMVDGWAGRWGEMGREAKGARRNRGVRGCQQPDPFFIPRGLPDPERTRPLTQPRHAPFAAQRGVTRLLRFPALLRTRAHAGRTKRRARGSLSNTPQSALRGLWHPPLSSSFHLPTPPPRPRSVPTPLLHCG